MRIQDVSAFEDLVEYLRQFGNPAGELAPYDFVGAFVLFDALLENLSRHYIDADLEALAESYELSGLQRQFLKRVLDLLPEKTQ